MGIIILIGWLNQPVSFTKEVLSGCKYTFTSPLRWNGKAWVATGEIGVGVYNVMLHDESIKEFIQSHRNDNFSKFTGPLGNGAITLGIGGGFWVTGNLTHNLQLQQAGKLGIKSTLVAGAITGCIKILAGRSRPYHGSYSDWTGLTLKDENSSFPSGHTTAAFAMASAIDETYDNKLIDILAYSTALLVGWSRMNDNMHWASDVTMGAVIGISTAKAIKKFEKSKKGFKD